MSRSIAESVSLLSETLGNCKTNLKEKEVSDVDNIKISDVDEKIAEIKSGGGEFDYTALYNDKIEKVEINIGNDEFQNVQFNDIVSLYGSGAINIKVTAKGTFDYSDQLSLLYQGMYKDAIGVIYRKESYTFEEVDTISSDATGGNVFIIIVLKNSNDRKVRFFSFTVNLPYNAG